MTDLQLFGELKESLKRKAADSNLDFQPFALQTKYEMKVYTDDSRRVWVWVKEEDSGFSFSYGELHNGEVVVNTEEGGQLTYAPEKHAFRLTYDGAEGEHFLSAPQVADLLITRLLKT